MGGVEESGGLSSRRKRWTRAELVHALSLYCRIPFGQLNHNQPDIVRMSSRLGRTPSSVSMKLCNFASLDPSLQARGIRGLTGASGLDRSVWAEFYGQWERLADEVSLEEAEEVEVAEHPTGGGVPSMPQRRDVDAPTEALAMVKVRKGQAFFRQAVLAAYVGRCCLTGIADRRLLRAGHIKPWSASPENRLNPSNGLALNAMHDAAFDAGLVTFDDDMRLVLSGQLRDAMPRDVHSMWFVAYAGRKIVEAEKFRADRALMAWHREKKFCA